MMLQLIESAKGEMLHNIAYQLRIILETFGI
jgi:hypothetical protein